MSLNYQKQSRRYNFLIFYGKDNIYFQLSDTSSVEDLKYLIYDGFRVRVNDQIITGWNKAPESNETLLSELDLDLETVLHVSVLKMSFENISAGASDLSGSGNYIQFSLNNELNASINFNYYYADNFSTKVPFFTGTLKSAVEKAFLDPDAEKCLFLYLHNINSPFSPDFCEKLTNDVLTNIVNQFVFLGWDLDDQQLLPDLITSLRENFSLEVAHDVERFMQKRNGVLIQFGLVEKEIMVVHRIDKCHSDSELISLIATTIQVCHELGGKRVFFGSKEFQQTMCDSLGNRDYDSFQVTEYEYLKDKIGFALFGSPILTDVDQKYNEKQQKIVEEIFKKILENGNCLEVVGDVNVGFVYACCEPLDKEKLKRSKKYTDYDAYSDMTPNPIFCVRKCQGSEDPCRIFIDNGGRVYKSWSTYVEKNKQTKCKMILPTNGRYTVNDCDKVLLEERFSNDCSVGNKILRGTDITTTGAGIASAGLVVAASVPAIALAPFVLTGALITGGLVGAYSLARSSMVIHDRLTHDETMRFSNSEARSAYLSIVAGALGFAGAGATQALSYFASQGINIGQGARIALNILNGTNIAIGGANIANQSYTIFESIRETNEGPTALMVLQLGSSILFFGHSVYNFRTAATIIDEAQLNQLKIINDSMRSNRHRNTLNKYTKETIRLHGDSQSGRAEVIQSFSKIQNRDEVFAFLTRSNKHFNENNVRFSADAATGLKLNGVSVNVAEIVNMSPQNKAQFISELPPIPPSGYVPDNLDFNLMVQNVFEVASLDMVKYFGKSILSGQSCQQISFGLLNQFSHGVQRKLVIFVKSFFRLSEFEDFNCLDMIRAYFPNVDTFYFILRGLINFLKEKASAFKSEYLRKKEIARMSEEFNEQEFDKQFFYIGSLSSLMGPVENGMKYFEKAVDMCFLSDGRVIETTVQCFVQYIADFMAKKILYAEKEIDNPIESYNTNKVNCTQCGGFYFR